MTDQVQGKKSGWPYPDATGTSQDGNRNQNPATPDADDPVEQELVDEQIAHDEKVTKAVDSRKQIDDQQK